MESVVFNRGKKKEPGPKAVRHALEDAASSTLRWQGCIRVVDSTWVADDAARYSRTIVLIISSFS